MYIKNKKHTYEDVTRKKYPDTVVFYGVSLTGAEISGKISTYRNDGFLMAEDNTSDYQYSESGEGYFRLTNNAPPSPPEPVPEEPTADEILNSLLGVEDNE